MNADAPIVVTLLGMVTEVRLLQPSNANPPIDVTLLGMLTVVRLLQYLKADTPIDVTLYSTPSNDIEAGISTVPEYLLGLLVTSASLALEIKL